MSPEHPVVLTIGKGIDRVIVPERLYQRVFPIADKNGQVVASITFSRNEHSTTVFMTLPDGLDSNQESVIIRNTVQCNYEMAVRDAIQHLARLFGLNVDTIRILIPLERT